MGKSYKKSNFKDWFNDGDPKSKKKKIIKEHIVEETDTDIDPEEIDLDSFVKHYNSK